MVSTRTAVIILKKLMFTIQLQIGLAGLASENTGGSVKFEFRINNIKYFSISISKIFDKLYLNLNLWFYKCICNSNLIECLVFYLVTLLSVICECLNNVK